MRELIINSSIFFVTFLILNILLVIITGGFIHHHVTFILIISLILGRIKSITDANGREYLFRSIKEKIARDRESNIKK